MIQDIDSPAQVLHAYVVLFKQTVLTLQALQRLFAIAHAVIRHADAHILPPLHLHAVDVDTEAQNFAALRIMLVKIFQKRLYDQRRHPKIQQIGVDILLQQNVVAALGFDDAEIISHLIQLCLYRHKVETVVEHIPQMVGKHPDDIDGLFPLSLHGEAVDALEAV